MQYSTAKTLADLLLRHLGEQNEILKEIQTLGPSEDVPAAKAMIGATMGAICLDALNPIFDEYPELKPPAMR